MGKGDKKSRKGKLHLGSYGKKRSQKNKKRNPINRSKRCIYCNTPLLAKRLVKEYQINNNNQLPNNAPTNDHVPQKCLFDGYSSQYTLNRYTVPCCHSCNQEFSTTEGELRNVIGISNENNINQGEISRRSARDIIEKQDGLSRFVVINGRVGYIVDQDLLLPSHIKNFKGLFFKTFNSILPQSFEIRVLDFNDRTNFKELIRQYLSTHTSWQKSGHEDIFKYRVARIKNNGAGDFIKANNNNEADVIVCQLIYHNKLEVIIIANRPSLIRRRIQ